MRLPVTIILIALSVLLHAGSAWADVNEIQALHLGKWIVKSNSSVQTITVNPDGSYNNTSGLALLSPPQEGIYDIDGLPASTIIDSITVTQGEPMDAGAGPEFTMDNFQVTAPPATDSGGHALVNVGVRAKTSGNGAVYPDSTYTGELDLSFNLNL